MKRRIESALIIWAAGIVILAGNNLMAQYQNDFFQLNGGAFGKYVTQGVAWADYDNDGYCDLYMSNGERNLPWEGFLYHNNGDGTFDSVATAGPIVSDVYISGGCSWGDYNNDGYLDLYVANLIKGFTTPPNSLFLNNGDGTFSNAEAGDIVLKKNTYSAGVGWADFDNDGYLDGFSSNVNQFGSATNHGLYKNTGDGSFISVSNALTEGVSGHGGFSWSDFDMDDDIDVVTVAGEMTEHTVLWVNTEVGFVPDTLLSEAPSQGASWGDFDGDGDLDLYITNHASETGPVPNRLFRFDGYNESNRPLFIEVETGDAVNDSDFSHGSAWGDIDNDGDLDLLVANDGSYKEGYRSRLYLNEGNGILNRYEETIFADSATFCRSLALADIENDGDLDVVVGRDGVNRLFINNGNDNNYIHFSLTGEGMMNKSAIGAVVKIKAGGSWQVRHISSQTGRGSQNDLRVHFGLGSATMVDSIVIHWTGTGISNTYNGLSANTSYGFSVNTLDDQPSNGPEGYMLLRNYPNPFNPVTTIRYSVGTVRANGNTPRHVDLSVYNHLGQKITTLVSGEKPAGEYEATWNASGYASGLYFYRLTTSGGTISRKMVLIK